MPFLPALFTAVLAIMPASKSTFSVTFTNIQQAKGQLFIAVYDRPEAFLKDQQARLKRVVPVGSKGSVSVDLGELPPGTYAVSSFHDVNGNGKMDKNLLGIPTEPYGFSNNARPSFRAPNWNEAKFQWNGSQTISIRLEKW
jgi:uncharacterized protein (DUF2141 family)